MTSLPTLKHIAPLAFLRLQERETIQRAYHESDDASFSKEGDKQAAQVLTKLARLQGYDCRITGATLGRYRSEINLVSHRSPRGALKAAAPASEPQSFLELQPEPPAVDATFSVLREIAILRDVLRSIDVHLESLSRAAWALVKRKAPDLTPIDAHESPRPVLVKEAAGGGQ